jgi:hypothetical protein
MAIQVENGDRIWQNLLKSKYLRSRTITQVQRKPRDSHFWSSLMWVKDLFLSLGQFRLNDGRNIWFWEDRWLGNYTLQHQYPSFYAITHWKNASVASVFSTLLPLFVA